MFNSSDNVEVIKPLTVARDYLVATSVVIDNIGYIFFGGGNGSQKSDIVDYYIVKDNLVQGPF